MARWLFGSVSPGCLGMIAHVGAKGMGKGIVRWRVRSRFLFGLRGSPSPRTIITAMVDGLWLSCCCFLKAWELGLHSFISSFSGGPETLQIILSYPVPGVSCIP